jgi:hypothetical protein
MQKCVAVTAVLQISLAVAASAEGSCTTSRSTLTEPQQNLDVAQEEEDETALLQLVGNQLKSMPGLQRAGQHKAITTGNASKAVSTRVKANVDGAVNASNARSVSNLTAGAPGGVVPSYSSSFWICTVTIMLGIAGFVLNRIVTKLSVGAGSRLLRLVLLCCGFIMCEFCRSSVTPYLAHELQNPIAVWALQLSFVVLFTALYAAVGARLTPLREQVMTWCFVSIPYCLNFILTFFAISGIRSAPLTTLRTVAVGCAPLATIALEVFIVPEPNTPFVTKSLVGATMLLFASSSLSAGAVMLGDVDQLIAVFTAIGAIIYYLYARRWLTAECKDLSTETCMVLQNSLGLPPAAMVAFGMSGSFDLGHAFFSDVTIILILSGAIATASSYFVLALLREVTATSFLVLMAATDMLNLLGLASVFHQPIELPWQAAALAVRFIAVLWYVMSQQDGQVEMKVLESARKAEAAKIQRMDSARKAKKEAVQRMREKVGGAAEAACCYPGLQSMTDAAMAEAMAEADEQVRKNPSRRTNEENTASNL